MSVGELSEREERPSYVQFETRTMEDKVASVREGRYVAKDFDVVLVTPSYSKDCVEYKVDQWLVNIERNLREGRIPEKWAEHWRESYKRWKAGQELPLSGTPIKGWGVISPAQQANLIAMNCRTVEDLAAANDDGLRRMGMGAVDLRTKARTWLASMNDHGGVTVKMATIEQENEVLKTTVESLTKQVEALKAMVKAEPQQVEYRQESNEITASDILDDTPPPPRRGRPPKQPSTVI
jgi:hypothetical protein